MPVTTPASGSDCAAPATPSAEAREFLGELAGLLQTPLPVAEFLAGFLPRVLAATAGVAGAVWLRNSAGAFELACQSNLATLGLEDHAALLNTASRSARPVWVPARSGVNPTEHGLLLAPVLLEQQVAGVVAIWRAGEVRGLSRLLGEASGFVAAYLHRAQWEQLRAEQQRSAQVRTYTRQLHSSLDPHEVAHLAANGGRLLLGCDQLSVALRPRGTTEVAAISGVPMVEPKSPLVRSLNALVTAVLDGGQCVVFRGQRDESLPPAIVQALDDYLARSNSRLLIVLPLGKAALVAECFGPGVAAEELQSRLEAIAPDVSAALGNALAHRGLPLRWLSGSLAGLADGMRGRRAYGVAAVAGALLVLLGILVFAQVPLRLEAHGELLPRDRQTVYAAVSGKVVEMKVRHGDAVAQGQELLLLENLELQLEVEQLELKASAAEQRVAVLNQLLGKISGAEDRSALLREKSTQEYELRRAAAERDILLHGARQPRRSPVGAPLAGKVVTFDVSEQLVGKSVKPGDPLLRVACIDGPWEIELYIPEGHVGAVREGLARSPQGVLGVDLLLACSPHRSFKGSLDRDGLGGETMVKDGVVVLPARVQIGDRDLLTQLEGMPVGVAVRARVRCGARPLGYVWFFGLWEFFYEHVVF